MHDNRDNDQSDEVDKVEAKEPVRLNNPTDEEVHLLSMLVATEIDGVEHTARRSFKTPHQVTLLNAESA